MSLAQTYVFGTIAIDGRRTNFVYSTVVRQNESLTHARTRLTRSAIDHFRTRAQRGQMISFMPEMHQTSTTQRGQLV